MGTAFYPRTSLLNQRQKWNAWDRYHIVDAYTEWQDEVRTIRERASALDQSPLSKHYISGPDALRLADYLITRDATKIDVGQIYYSPWCNQNGVVVGDGLVARVAPDRFMFTADPMMNWFRHHAEGYDVTIEDITFDFGLLALQGPASTAVIEAATGESLVRPSVLAAADHHRRRRGAHRLPSGLHRRDRLRVLRAHRRRRRRVGCAVRGGRAPRPGSRRPARGRRGPDRGRDGHRGRRLHPGRHGPTRRPAAGLTREHDHPAGAEPAPFRGLRQGRRLPGQGGPAARARSRAQALDGGDRGRLAGLSSASTRTSTCRPK